MGPGGPGGLMSPCASTPFVTWDSPGRTPPRAYAWGGGGIARINVQMSGRSSGDLKSSGST